MKIYSLRAKWMLRKGMMRESTISHSQNLLDVKGMAIEQWLKNVT